MRYTINMIAGATLLFAGANMAWAGNPFNGKPLYLKHCAGCHGERGESNLLGVPNFSRGEIIISSTDPMLVNSIKQGKGVMPGFNGLIKDADILDVIAYMRTLF